MTNEPLNDTIGWWQEAFDLSLCGSDAARRSKRPAPILDRVHPGRVGEDTGEREARRNKEQSSTTSTTHESDTRSAGLSASERYAAAQPEECRRQAKEYENLSALYESQGMKEKASGMMQKAVRCQERAIKLEQTRSKGAINRIDQVDENGAVQFYSLNRRDTDYQQSAHHSAVVQMHSNTRNLLDEAAVARLADHSASGAHSPFPISSHENLPQGWEEHLVSSDTPRQRSVVLYVNHQDKAFSWVHPSKASLHRAQQSVERAEACSHDFLGTKSPGAITPGPQLGSTNYEELTVEELQERIKKMIRKPVPTAADLISEHKRRTSNGDPEHSFVGA